METSMFWKIAKQAIQLYTASDTHVGNCIILITDEC